jgi:hypothetical protein
MNKVDDGLGVELSRTWTCDLWTWALTISESEDLDLLLTTVRGTAKFPYAVLPTSPLPSFRTWHCQIWHYQTTVRDTAKFPYVALPNLVLPSYCHGHCHKHRNGHCH